jgi:GntR family transcriptional regulator
VRAVQKVAAINLSAKDADLLGFFEGTGGPSIERPSCPKSGCIAENNQPLYCRDAHDFVTELRLSIP